MDNFDFDGAADIFPNGEYEKAQKQAPSTFARIFGIVMVVASVVWLIASVDIWNTEMARMKSFGTLNDPKYYFVNPMEITGSLGLITFLQGFALLLITLGIYRIIYARKSRRLVFVAFPVFFAIAIGQALYINSVRETVVKDVLANEHSWAEHRYGVTYDEITTKEIKANESRKRKVQDEVKKDGQVIANVCESENRWEIYFCEPGTSTELSTAAYSESSEIPEDYDASTPDTTYDETSSLLEPDYSGG